MKLNFSFKTDSSSAIYLIDSCSYDDKLECPNITFTDMDCDFEGIFNESDNNRERSEGGLDHENIGDLSE